MGHSTSSDPATGLLKIMIFLKKKQKNQIFLNFMILFISFVEGDHLTHVIFNFKEFVLRSLYKNTGCTKACQPFWYEVYC